MYKPDSDNTYFSWAISIVLHLAVFFLLFIGWQHSAKNYTVPAKQIGQVVNATTVDDQAIKQTMAQIQQKEDQRQQQLKLQQQQAAAAAAEQKAAQQKIAAMKAEQQAVAEKLKQQQTALAQAKQNAEQQQARAAAEKAKADAAEKLRLAKEQQQKKLADALSKAQQEMTASQIKAEQQQLQRAQATQQANAEVDKYKALIVQAISQNWVVPSTVSPDLSCILHINLAPGGVVTNVSIVKSSGDSGLDNSAMSAVYKASPLPVPDDTKLFDQFRELNLTVRPLNLTNSG